MNPAKPKRWNAPDLTDFERENDELNQALWRSFADLRDEVSSVDSEPQENTRASDNFESEVQAKIAAAQDRLQKTSGFAKQAAAFLPPFLLPKALAPIATTSGSKSSAAFVPGVAALPALAFATLIFSGIAFLRYVFSDRRNQTQENDQKSSGLEIKDWWRANIWKTLLVFAGVLTLALHNPIEAVVLSLTLSTIALFGLLTTLAASGYATRREVGRVAYQFLYFAALFGWQFIQNDVFGFHQQVGHAFVVPTLVFAAAACFGLLKDSRKAWILALGVATAVVLGIQVFGSLIGRKPIDLERSLAYLSDERHANQFGSVASWEEYTASRRHLQAAGRELEPWIALTEGMQRTLQASLKKGKFNNLYALDMMNVDALRPQDVSALKSDYKWANMFDPEKPYALRSEDVQVRLRLLTMPMSLIDKMFIADRLEKELRSHHDYNNLEKFMIGTRTLEILGYEDRIPALKPIADSLLQATWQATRDGQQGNFVSYPSLVKRDEDGRMSSKSLSFVHIESTGLAVEAMGRWGVPEGIDLQALHAYLKETAKTYSSKTPSSYSLLAECARLHLETLPEYQAQRNAPSQESPWQWFLRHRLLLASLLLAVGGVWSTWRAPR